MNELTPEERQKIYLEEKARLEFRPGAPPPYPPGSHIKKGLSPIAVTALLVIAGLVFLIVAGTLQVEANDARNAARTPEQKRADSQRSCAVLERAWAFKLYSELTPEERRIKLSCEMDAK